MKKIIFILCFVLLTGSASHAEEETQKFKNLYFYQRLTDVYDNTTYILTPNSKFFEIAAPATDDETGYGTIDCTLLQNKENFIKMRCNDCTDTTCQNYQEHINTFEILQNNDVPNKHYIRHQIIDEKTGTLLRENLLWLDNIMSIHPNQ